MGGPKVTGRDIVCLSTHFWDGPWFRKQEFMSRFSRANRVLFVEPSFSMARRPEPYLRHLATNRYIRRRLESRTENLFLFKPPRGLPRWTDPRVERLTYRWYGRLIRDAMSDLGFRDAILWNYRPSYFHSLDLIPHEHLVFDLVDDLAAGAGDAYSLAAEVERSVLALVRRSDVLLVTAKTLLERYGPHARRAEYVPNGFDAELFGRREADWTKPVSLTEVETPVLIYVGTLFAFIDFDLLAEVARAHSDKTLVLVGPIEDSARNEALALTRLPNVVHVGMVPRAEVASYIAASSVCLNPFRSSRAADSVNPLKVYEYLAVGRPVVSTPMKALQMEDVASMVEFATDPRDFCERINHCLTEDVQAAVRERRDAVAPYAWTELFRRADAAVEKALAG